MDIERMTGLPIDQLLDITACVAPLLDPDKVAAWTALDLFESVVIITVYRLFKVRGEEGVVSVR